MERFSSIRLTWLSEDMARAFSGGGHSRFNVAGTWRPAINAYRCDCSIRICVDLAGVRRENIDLHVEATRVVLRGIREAPEPGASEPRPRQILALEIDHGPFARELLLPVEVDPAEASAEQREGFLWITLPLRKAP